MSLFKLYKSTDIENIGKGYEYRHNTGCRLIYIENEDINRVFTIGFNTLPENDKGIPHIVEHCVLCGSENYRVKDPFNILDKGSIHTYLNAMTYRDKTVYPVASTNEGDFKTLINVYCDAVFKPLMYENEGIFRQEGWNSNGKEYSGIVLNEMKGVYSDPAVMLSEAINKEMFKGGYGNDAGGNPDDIINLSYREFLKFHKEHYHPSNCVMYLYGKINVEEYLNIIDEKYLKDFEYRESPKIYSVNVKEKGSVCLRKKTGSKNILSVAFNTGESGDVVKCTMLGILSTLWCYTEGGNIKEALLRAGLGDKVSCGFDDSGVSSCMEITVENSDETDIERFKKVLNDTFIEMAEKGIDEYKLKGVINNIKFFFKEEDFGYKPKGLFYGLLVLNSYLKGRENFESIEINKIFNEIENIDIKEIIKKYFIDKGVYGILISDSTVEENEEKACSKNNESLIEYQNSVDSQEEIKKLMTTKVSDISKEGFKVKYEEDGENILVPMESDDIVYIDIYFDVSKFENILALNGFRAVCDVYDEKLSNDIDYYAGGFSVELTTLHRDTEFRPVMAFKIKCLRENVEKCIEIFERIISQKFESEQRLERIVSEAVQNMKNAYIEAGNTKAIGEALAQVSGASMWENKGKGLDFYTYFKGDIGIIEKDINSVKNVFQKGSAFYALAGKSIDGIKKIIDASLDRLERKGSLNIIKGSISTQSVGICTEGNVCFNAAAFESDGNSGISRVAQQIISREYLWDKVRLEGGAYGGGCVFGKRYGYMYSYRDPNIEKTYNVFKDAGKYLAESNYTQSDIDRFIIGTINEIDAPIKKHSLTGIAMRKAFAKEKKGITIKRREEILTAAPRDIVEFGERLKNREIKGICTVGNEKEVIKFGRFDVINEI